MTSPGTRRAVLGIAALVLAADQASKSLVVAIAPGGGGGGLRLGLAGAQRRGQFGIGAGHPMLVAMVAAGGDRRRLRVLAPCPAAVPVALFLGRRPRRRGTGNLADRLLRSPGFGRGAVVDWIHLAGYPATFNVADVAIRLGAAGALAAALGTWSRVGGRRIRARALLPSGPRAVEDPEQPGRQAGR